MDLKRYNLTPSLCLLLMLAALFGRFPQQTLAQQVAKVSDFAVPSVVRDQTLAAPSKAAGVAQELLLNQSPNQANGIFSDANCDFCGLGAQSVAENFTLDATEAIDQIIFWGGFFPSDVPTTDIIKVIFRSDAGGLPGAAVATPSVTSDRSATGMILFGVSQYEYTLDISPVTLGPGTYWVEIFNNTSGSAENFFWELGNLDATNGSTGFAFAFATPGSGWSFSGGQDMALQLRSAGADLGLSKECEVHDNGTGSFHLTVSNAGPANASGVKVQDQVSKFIDVTGSNGDGIFNSGGRWTVGDLDAGDAASRRIDFSFDLDVAGLYLNPAEIIATDQDDPDLSNDFAECGFLVLGDGSVTEAGGGAAADRFKLFEADLEINKAVDVETAAVSARVHYTVWAANNGPHSTKKVQVTDNLPACLTDVTWNTSQGTYDLDTGVWDIGALKVDETDSLEVWATVGSNCANTVTNKAWVSRSSLPDPPVSPKDPNALLQGPFEIRETLRNNADEVSFTVESGSGRVLDGTRFALGRNYPNPFNPTTIIPFSLTEASPVSIKVYDMLGREVAVLVDGALPAGAHEVVFEANTLPTGMYLIRMEAAGIVQTQRMTLMK